jgi:D-alanine-D-alanine ligase
MPRPAIVFGGPSPEHDISVSTGLQATHTLGDVWAIYWDKQGRFHAVDPAAEPVDFAEGIPRKARELGFSAVPGGGFTLRRKPLDISVVVNCCHGGPGEDGTLQAAFELVGYRFTGPGSRGSALGMDKFAFSATVAALGLPVLPRLLLGPDTRPDFPPPYIVKPRYGGSSIGIEITEDVETALALLASSPHLREGAVIEPYLADCRDLQVAVRTYPEFQTSAIEEPLRAEAGLYSYRQKYLAWGESGQAARRLPADVDPPLAEQVKALARRVAELCQLRSVGRVDFLERGGELWVNEVNTIPGSLAAYLWIDPPIDRATLLADMITEAETQPPRIFSAAGADGTALRSARSIAAKLGG